MSMSPDPRLAPLPAAEETSEDTRQSLDDFLRGLDASALAYKLRFRRPGPRDRA